MSILDRAFAKLVGRYESSVAVGRKTTMGNGYIMNGMISPYKSRTSDVLATLRKIDNDVSAVEFLKQVSPDVSMAVWNFVKLANQGHSMKFYDANNPNTRMIDLEDKWRTFASRINEISNSGLDGLIDQLHYSSFLLGAMGIEVDVESDLTDIHDVYPVKPQTIIWYLEDRNGRPVWIPYQWQVGKTVSLEKGQANFFWCPADPEIGDPRGTLAMSSVLQAIDFQMQILQDMQAVLHHQGWPRDDYSISMERLMQSCPSDVKGNSVKLNEWLKLQYDNVINTLRNIQPDSDVVHFDDVTRNPQGNGNNVTRSLDVRAINDLVDVQTLSGTKQLAIFMNRNQGVTESWGTVQFRIFCSSVASCQQGSKRLVEEIARLWCRVNGVQAIPVFIHNTIDWNSEEQRMNVNLMKQQFYAIAQLMKWIDKDTAASEVMGVDKAIGEAPTDIVNISFINGGGKNERNDKCEGPELPNPKIVDFKRR